MVKAGILKVVIKKPGMKARLKTKITIAADAANIFKYLSHTKYQPLWNMQMKSATPLVQLHEGSVYKVQLQVLGVRTKAENHITKYVQDKELEIQNMTGMIQYSSNFRLEPQAKGTRVICTISVSSQSKAFAFAKPMMEHLARRELNIDLKALKKVVEQALE